MNKRHRPEDRTTAIGRLDLRSRKVRARLVLGIMLLYALLFFPLYSLLGPIAAALALLPVAAVGWLLGMPAGVLAGLLVFPLHFLLLSLVGETWRLMTGTGLAGSLVLVIIGAMVGRLRDQGERIKEEFTARKRAQEASQERLKELEIYYRATMERESRIIELKHQVNRLLERLGEKKKYDV